MRLVGFAVFLLLSFLPCACGTTKADASGPADAFVPDSSPKEGPCRLVGTTCETLDDAYECCPQKGYPYDFSSDCFSTTLETVYCHAAEKNLLGCSSEGLVSCYFEPDSGSSRAWFYFSTWNRPEAAGYESCYASAVLGDFRDKPWCGGDGGTRVGSGGPPP